MRNLKIFACAAVLLYGVSAQAQVPTEHNITERWTKEYRSTMEAKWEGTAQRLKSNIRNEQHEWAITFLSGLLGNAAGAYWAARLF